MASSRSKVKPDATMEELTAQITKLSMENKQLRKALGAASDPADRPVSSMEKEARLVAAVSALSAAASKKIESRVRACIEKCVTVSQLENALSNLHMRIDLSLSETGASPPQAPAVSAGNRRRRAASRSRRDDD
ncbi:ORF52 [Retroperitoneal fibromatosis-associated herpesvirus]|uniref:ORF52 n=1 Tax=Retroperitoneal fibromatosis-associated herpesvirus TaxID=111469 RepID=U5NIX8_9GAMA|nr:ORF52 [Retroperitoneal fibromatosis-associated herpesvirus]AGY30734.1 ORF52 [Retroperitoneal fibromatosis-associated herpesvirus]